MVAPLKESVIQLYPYQQRFFADDARVLVAVWCRQAGKDFVTACKAVDHAIRTGQDWYIVSKTQRQADATFAKCRQVADAFKAALKLSGKITTSDGEEYYEYDKEIDHWFRQRARTLHLPNGGTVTSLPGLNPDPLAGLTGNVILTEFALFADGGYKHWRVIFPLTTRGFHIIIITTTRGKNTKAHELRSSPEKYSVHVVDIHQAVAEGMPLKGEDGRDISIEQFRELYGDEIGWRREYLCEATGDLEALVKWGQLSAATITGPFDLLKIEAGAGWKSGFFQLLKEDGGRAEMGWDVARHGHLSSLWVNKAGPGGRKDLRALVLMHETSFALQREIITEAMEIAPANVGCGDSTGLGMDSNETLANRYGDRWLPVTFTGASKRDLGSGLMTAFDDGAQRIPPVDGPHKFIATDIYALQREGGTGKDNLKLAESDNPLMPESHCDIAWSAALAIKAASLAGVTAKVWVPV